LRFNEIPRFSFSDFRFGISGLATVPSAVHSPNRLRSLNALRFLAALLVFSQHVPAFHAGDGYCGVVFFFILSGFILTYTYQPTLARRCWPGVWRFWANRIARIYPVHVLTFILFLPYWWPALRVQPATYVSYACRNLTLTHAWSNDSHLYFSYNVPSWSLCNECFFYLCFPAMLWLLNRPAVRSWRFPIFIGALWLAQLSYCSRCDGPDFVWRAYINPSLRLIDFTIGMLLALWFLQRKETGLWQSFGLATALELTAFGTLLLASCGGRGLSQAVRMGAFFTLPMAAIVFIFAHDAGVLSRLLSRQPFQFLGDISFSFFMLHYVLLGLWAKYEPMLGRGSCPEPLKQFLVIASSLAAAAFVFVVYERPIRGAIKAGLRPRLPPPSRPVFVCSGRVALEMSASGPQVTQHVTRPAASVRSKNAQSEEFSRPSY
jgi:peptidoglycan/LPS O-acetylase OafA/YrhL